MKEFFRSFLGSCLGVFVALLLIVLVIFGIGAAATSGLGGGGETTTKKSENSVLKLDLGFMIPEKTDNIPASFASQPENVLGLRHIVRLIQNASEDSNVKGIVINGSEVQLGQASLLQLRNVIEEFKTKGKFVYAYADNYSQAGYILSSVADSVYLHPYGEVDLHGFGVVTPFFKGALDKLGVNFDVFYAGDFKSATEPFRRTDMSPENKLQTREFLDEMLDIMKSEISKSRKISETEIDNIMTNLGGRNADISKSSKLVDEIVYWDQFQNKVRRNIKLKEDEKINYLSLKEYNILAALSEKGSSDSKVAVVYAEGEVSYNNSQKGIIDNKKYLKILEKIKNDDKIKAVVLRVNSGGGSALTSEIIWREIENIKAKGKPVVASFGDYAASGGYYIAAGANSIVAAPNTLTGSIGVFSMLPNFKKLANEKMGITFDTVKTHALGVNLSTIYPLSETEKKYMTEMTDKIYKTFLQRVANGRKMSVDSVHKYAQGRVWTGSRAKEIGLVDEVGFLQDAIVLAAKQAKLSSYKVDEYPKIKKDVWQEIFANLAKSQSSDDEEDASFQMNQDALKLYNTYIKYRNLINAEGVQARMLYDFEF